MVAVGEIGLELFTFLIVSFGFGLGLTFGVEKATLEGAFGFFGFGV